MSLPRIGGWLPSHESPGFHPDDFVAATRRTPHPAVLVQDPASGAVGVGFGGAAVAEGGWPLLASLPAVYAEWLGDRSFAEVHGARFPYVAGAMANGIHTADMTIACAEAGLLGFFGAAGLSFGRVEENIARLVATLAGRTNWGANLIHSPNEPDLEAAVADLFLRAGVRRVEASAYMALTPSIVRYACTGLRARPDGSVERQNFVFAKISRPEVARRFLEPAPAEMLAALVGRGLLTADEAALARRIPLATDLSVEADSGGHTDNRPMPALFPAIQATRDEIARQYGYTEEIRLGAGGGIGSPHAVAAAFALGAAYVLTGSVNQACVESGLSPAGRAMLVDCGIADVTMAPAADMFELGVTVQVLHRGTLFATRGRKLYQLYREHPSLDAIPAAERARVEKEILRASFPDAWASTRAFWMARDPREVARAEADPKHLMALVFRSYLGLSSRWAIAGDESRRMDYQIWCGPAMGAFNAWTRGTFLADPAQRRVVQVAYNLLDGATAITRAHQLRAAGAPVPAAAFDPRPRNLLPA